MSDRLRVRLTRFHVCLGAIVAVGFVLRVWGNRFGLPFLYHEDEGEIVRRALRMPVDGPNPGWFQYPTLYVYVQAVACAAGYAWSRLAGSAAGYAAFADAAMLDPTAVYAFGRTVTATFGAATIAVTGVAARRFATLGEAGRDLAGLAAAALVCVDLLHVEHSHYITADVAMTMAAAGALLAVARLSVAPGGGGVRDYAVAGVLVGVSASFKYPGALFAIAVAAAYAQGVAWRTRDDWKERARDPRLPAAAVASLAGFVAGSPYVLLDWRTFVRDFAAEAAHMRAGHLGFETVRNHWGELLGNAVASGGILLVVCAAAGAVAVLRTKDAFGRTLAVTLAALVVFAGSSNVLFARYLIPMLPVAAMLGAYALVAASGVLARGRARRQAGIAAAAVAGVLVLPGWLVAHRLALFTAPDTRTEAWTWVNASLRAPGDRIAVEWKSIPHKPVTFDIAEAVPVVYDVAALRASGVRYVAVTDRLYRRFLRAPDRYPGQVAFYRDVLLSGRPVAAFTPFRDDRSRLVLDDGGAPSVVRAASGTPWAALLRRERSGPVILIFDIGG